MFNFLQLREQSWFAGCFITECVFQSCFIRFHFMTPSCQTLHILCNLAYGSPSECLTQQSGQGSHFLSALLRKQAELDYKIWLSIQIPALLLGHCGSAPSPTQDEGNIFACDIASVCLLWRRREHLIMVSETHSCLLFSNPHCVPDTDGSVAVMLIVWLPWTYLFELLGHCQGL